jgi:hypothetical protein
MKRIQLSLALALLATLGMLALSMTGCTGSGQNDKTTQGGAQKDGKSAKYTCSMHPEVVLDKPGDCPKCGMKLVEKH